MSEELKRALSAAGLNQIAAIDGGFEAADTCDAQTCTQECQASCGSKCSTGCAPGHQGGGS